jgi:hypothetical protein
MNSHQHPGHPDSPAFPDLRSLHPHSNDTVLLRAWEEGDLPVIEEASTDPYIPLITTVPASYTPRRGTPGCNASTTRPPKAADARWPSSAAPPARQ